MFALQSKVYAICTLCRRFIRTIVVNLTSGWFRSTLSFLSATILSLAVSEHVGEGRKLCMGEDSGVLGETVSFNTSRDCRIARRGTVPAVRARQARRRV